MLKSKKKKMSTCSFCSKQIEPEAPCQKCSQISHADCKYRQDNTCDACNPTCMICGDGECSCDYDLDDLEEFSSASENESFGDDISTSSGESSVYEEPEEYDTDEDIMAEIVRERLLNGWDSEEDFGSSPSSDHEHEDEMLKAETAAIKNDYNMKSFGNSNEIYIAPPITQDPITQDFDVDVKKVGELAFNGKWAVGVDQVKTPKPKPDVRKTPVSSNPWAALSAIKQQSSGSAFANPFSTNPSPSLFAPSKKKEKKSVLSTPFKLNLDGSPATVKSSPFSTPRPPSSGLFSRPKISLNQIETLLKQKPSSTSVFEAIPNEEEVDDNVLFEEMFNFEETAQPLNQEVADKVDFSRFKQIPIGTFRNSQRKYRPKKRELLSAIKKTSSRRVLDSTLLETMPRVKKKRSGSLFFSPQFGPCQVGNVPSESLEFLDNTFGSIPPPFEL